VDKSQLAIILPFWRRQRRDPDDSRELFSLGNPFEKLEGVAAEQTEFPLFIDEIKPTKTPEVPGGNAPNDHKVTLYI